MLNTQGADMASVDREGDDLQARIAEMGVELEHARSDIDGLHRALESARRIGAAVGIVMATRKVSEDAAFEVLRLASQTSNRKLREVADEVVLTGLVPATRPGT